MNDELKNKNKQTWLNRAWLALKNIKKRTDNKASSNEQIWYMPNPIILDEVHSRTYVLLASAIICGLLFVLFLWAAFSSIDETAITYGVLVPAGKINVVQHLEGGIIKSIEVKDGDIVKQGQPLLVIDETASLAELHQLQARESTLSANVNRLRAFVENSDLNEDPQKNTEKSMSPQLNFKDIMKAEQELLGSENQLRQDQEDVL